MKKYAELTEEEKSMCYTYDQLQERYEELNVILDEIENRRLKLGQILGQLVIIKNRGYDPHKEVWDEARKILKETMRGYWDIIDVEDKSTK